MTSQSHLLIPPPCCCCSSHVYPPPSFVGARRHLHIWRRRHSGFPWFPLPRRRRPPPSLLQPALPTVLGWPGWVSYLSLLSADLPVSVVEHQQLRISQTKAVQTGAAVIAPPLFSSPLDVPLLASSIEGPQRSFSSSLPGAVAGHRRIYLHFASLHHRHHHLLSINILRPIQGCF